MEPGQHWLDGFDPAIPWEERIEGATERAIGPIGGGTETDGLSGGVHAGIGSSCCVGHCSAAKETLEYPLDFDLYRAANWLALPPDKAGAVVVKRGEEGPAHRPGI
jgi:hypothetical protein